ncbi:MAG: hypothetical protein ACOWWO_16635 [Peptococcaceae bacterium]
MPMITKVLYLYPEFEGQQHFVCWGFAKDTLDKNADQEIKALALAGLENISEDSSRWVSKRSFSLFLGEDAKNYWVAVPRQLTAKALKHMAVKFSHLNPQIIITSSENSFGDNLPFEPVVSYDRGFIFDSTGIEEKLVISANPERIVNA